MFGEPAAYGNRAWLARRVGWRLQAIAEGDLSDRAKARVAMLARDADLRLTAQKEPPEPAALRPRSPPSSPASTRAPSFG